MTDWYGEQMADDAMLGAEYAECKWHGRPRFLAPQTRYDVVALIDDLITRKLERDGELEPEDSALCRRCTGRTICTEPVI